MFRSAVLNQTVCSDMNWKHSRIKDDILKKQYNVSFKQLAVEQGTLSFSTFLSEEAETTFTIDGSGVYWDRVF